MRRTLHPIAAVLLLLGTAARAESPAAPDLTRFDPDYLGKTTPDQLSDAADSQL